MPRSTTTNRAKLVCLSKLALLVGGTIFSASASAIFSQVSHIGPDRLLIYAGGGLFGLVLLFVGVLID